jgi:hypothetical protein
LALTLFFFRENAKSFAFRFIDRKEVYITSLRQGWDTHTHTQHSKHDYDKKPKSVECSSKTLQSELLRQTEPMPMKVAMLVHHRNYQEPAGRSQDAYHPNPASPPGSAGSIAAPASAQIQGRRRRSGYLLATSTDEQACSLQ